MKNVVLISSVHGASVSGQGTFGAAFWNLAEVLDGSREVGAWKAAMVVGGGPRRLAGGVKSPFEVPSSVGGGLRGPLRGFSRIVDAQARIGACVTKLAEYSGLLGRADLVHALDMISAAAFTRSGARAAGPKLCITPTDILRSGDAERRPTEAEVEILRAADRVIVPGRAYARELERRCGPLARMSVVQPGIEDDKRVRTGMLRRRLGVPVNALMAATFCGPGRGLEAEFFVKAFAEAHSALAGRFFGLIYGAGAPALADTIRSSGLEDALFLAGPGDPGWDALSESDIFFSAGGSPDDMAVIEALRAGLAVVAADEGWSAEASGYGEAACPFKAGDAAAAGAALSGTASDPRDLKHLSAKARGYFVSRYTLGAFAARAAASYSEAVSPADTMTVRG